MEQKGVIVHVDNININATCNFDSWNPRQGIISKFYMLTEILLKIFFNYVLLSSVNISHSLVRNTRAISLCKRV